MTPARGSTSPNLKLELAAFCCSLIPELQKPMGQSTRRSDEPAGYHGDCSHLTGHLLKTELYPKLIVKLSHLEMFSKALTPFFFKPCLHWGFITEIFTIKWAASTIKLPCNDRFWPHRGSDLGAQWEPSGLVTALEGNSPVWDVELLPLCFLLQWKTDSATEETCSKQSLCFVTARSNLNLTS